MSTPSWSLPKYLLPFGLLSKMSTSIRSALWVCLLPFTCQNVYSHLIFAKLSSPFWSTLPKYLSHLVSFAKMSFHIWSTLPKCLLTYRLLCQNIFSHLVYFAKMSAPVHTTLPECLFWLGLLCQNVYSHLVYFAKMSTPIGFTLPFNVSSK